MNQILNALAFLESNIRCLVETHFNTDLSKVRIHTDSTAHDLSQRVQAVAFTTGQHIFFRAGRYNPDSSSGFELLAHEVAHTMQQGTGQVSPGIDSDPSLESAAQLEGQKAVAQKSVLEQKANTLNDFIGFPKLALPIKLRTLFQKIRGSKSIPNS